MRNIWKSFGPDALECQLICDLSTDHSKRELSRLASHLNTLADEVEQAMHSAEATLGARSAS
jgi:hypothetical protein